MPDPHRTVQQLAQLAGHRRRPNRADDVVAVDSDAVDVAVADDDGGVTDDDHGSPSGDDSHAFHGGHAFHASHGSPVNHNLANASAAIADVVAVVVANEGGDGDAAVEVATATDPNLHPVRHHYSAMDGLALNGKPPLAERRGSFRLLVARDDPDGVEVRWLTR